MKSIRTAFIGNVTRLIQKIDNYIHDESEKPGKVVCLGDKFTVTCGKMKEVNMISTYVRQKTLDNIESANDLF